MAKRPVRRPDKTLATADHNVPTDGTKAARLIADRLSRVQVETLERNCEEFGIPIYSLGSERQGIVHVIGPELGVTQPGMTIVCGDSHTSTHGAFGASPSASAPPRSSHVLATQCLVQKQPKTMRILYSGELGAGVTPKDLILATIGRLGTGGMVGHAVEYAGRRSSRSRCGADDGLQHTIEGGGRAGIDRPDETTFDVVRGRPARRRTSTRRLRAGAICDRGRRDHRHRGRDRRRGHLADGHLGHQPGDGGRGHRLGPRSGRDGVARRPRIGRTGRSPTWRLSPARR
jgi:3-isopropylmalate/(R)-2-methylmalate dehydratase large subunit